MTPIPDHSTISISVVIPVYRNSGMLHELFERLQGVFEKKSLSYEIIFVVDACPENSRSILETMSKKEPSLRVLNLEKNLGQQRAIFKGLALARGRVVVVMDGDLQDPPEAIPELLKKMEEGYSAVFAGRRGAYESPLRLLTSKVFKRTLHFLTRVPTDSGAFVAMDRKMVDHLLSMNASFIFLVALIGATGLKVTSIPVIRSPRPHGTSSYNFWMRLKVGLKTLLWVVVNKKRSAF